MNDSLWNDLVTTAIQFSKDSKRLHVCPEFKTFLENIEHTKKILPLPIFGASRQGKSTLLNLIYHIYKHGTKSNKLVKNHFNANPSQAGKAVTKDINYCRELIHVGDDMYILLMDSQGLFNNGLTRESDNMVVASILMIAPWSIFNVLNNFNQNDAEILTACSMILLSEFENPEIKFNFQILIRDYDDGEEYQMVFPNEKLKKLYSEPGNSTAFESIKENVVNEYINLCEFGNRKKGEYNYNDLDNDFKKSMEKYYEYLRDKLLTMKNLALNGRELCNKIQDIITKIQAVDRLKYNIPLSAVIMYEKFKKSEEQFLDDSLKQLSRTFFKELVDNNENFLDKLDKQINKFLLRIKGELRKHDNIHEKLKDDHIKYCTEHFKKHKENFRQLFPQLKISMKDIFKQNMDCVFAEKYKHDLYLSEKVINQLVSLRIQNTCRVNMEALFDRKLLSYIDFDHMFTSRLNKIINLNKMFSNITLKKSFPLAADDNLVGLKDFFNNLLYYATYPFKNFHSFPNCMGNANENLVFYTNKILKTLTSNKNCSKENIDKIVRSYTKYIDMVWKVLKDNSIRRKDVLKIGKKLELEKIDTLYEVVKYGDESKESILNKLMEYEQNKFKEIWPKLKNCDIIKDDYWKIIDTFEKKKLDIFWWDIKKENHSDQLLKNLKDNLLDSEDEKWLEIWNLIIRYEETTGLNKTIAIEFENCYKYFIEVIGKISKEYVDNKNISDWVEKFDSELVSFVIKLNDLIGNRSNTTTYYEINDIVMAVHLKSAIRYNKFFSEVDESDTVSKKIFPIFGPLFSGKQIFRQHFLSVMESTELCLKLIDIGS